MSAERRLDVETPVRRLRERDPRVDEAILDRVIAGEAELMGEIVERVETASGIRHVQTVAGGAGIVREIRADGSFDPITWTVPSSGATFVMDVSSGPAAPAAYAPLRSFEVGPLHAVEADPPTEVIPAVAPALVDPLPPAPAGHGRRARPPRSLLRSLVNAGSLGVLIATSFLAGQWTTQNGVEPVLPLPASDVHTAAAVARLWSLNTPAEQQQTCGYLATLGETRDIVLAQWVGHLQSQVGGRLDEVNRGVVAGVLDNACAGRAPGGGKG